MDFNIVGTAIVLLLSLSLISMALFNSSNVNSKKTLSGIIEDAKKGKAGRIHFKPPGDFDMCEYLGWSNTCDDQYGVIEFCEVFSDTEYEITATPNNGGVCLNITEV